MEDEFVNRLTAFQTSRDFLFGAKQRPIWKDQKPLVFTDKVNAARDTLADLEAFCREQEAATTGAAQEKERRILQLRPLIHPVARTLVQWFRDHADHGTAARVDLEESAWAKLRDAQEVEKIKLVRDLAVGLVEGEPATAAQAARYGIDAETLAGIRQPVDDYLEIVNRPRITVSDRRRMTDQLRSRFNQMERAFAPLDDLILQFNGTEAGRQFIAGYREARRIVDAGHGPKDKTPVPPAAPAPQ